MKKAFLKTLKDNDLKITKNRMAILKELEKARKDLEVSSKNAKDALEALKSLEKDAQEKYNKYLQIKRQYDMENYTWGVTKNPPVVDLPELSAEDLEKILTNNSRTLNTISNAKYKQYSENSRFENNSLVKDREGRVLPNTGSSSASTTGVAALLAAVALAARKRKSEK